MKNRSRLVLAACGGADRWAYSLRGVSGDNEPNSNYSLANAHYSRAESVFGV
ncbi:hypothetical protein HNP00_003549 [Arthrobacter sp. AZCC_0090]|nr:hypothetical protein [Arthrobacter sp. AZCC_0090]